MRTTKHCTKGIRVFLSKEEIKHRKTRKRRCAFKKAKGDTSFGSLAAFLNAAA